MSSLLIGLPEALYHDQALEYVLVAAGQVVDSGRVPAAQLPDLKDRDHEVVALAPPRALSWHPVQLPPGIHAQSPRLRAVLEGLLEDQLLDPPGELHLALAEDNADPAAPRWVAACERRWLATAVQGLQEAGCRLSRVLPEWGPPGPSRLHITGTADQAEMLLCSPHGVSLLALNAENLAWALSGSHDDMRWSAEPEWLEIAQEHLPGPVQPWPRSQRWLAAARPRWDLARGLMMRQQLRRSPLQWFKAPRWRALRWATLGLMGVNLAGFNALAWSTHLHLQSQRAQLQHMLWQAFPQASLAAAADPAEQMQRELARLRTASTRALPEDLAVMLSAVLPALPADRSPQGLDYTPGQLRLQGLDLSDDQVRALSQRLQAQGYVARLEGQELQLRTGP